MNVKRMESFIKNRSRHQLIMRSVLFSLAALLYCTTSFSNVSAKELVGLNHADYHTNTEDKSNKKLITKTSRISGTDVSGNLIDNDTWTKANSPYNIVGDVGVPGGLTLTIEAGVAINYTGDFRILVFGAIQVNGTEADSVRFNGNSMEGTKYMLEIRRSNLDNSKIDYAVMKGPQGAVLQGLQTDNTPNFGELFFLRTRIYNSVVQSNPQKNESADARIEIPTIKFFESQIRDSQIFGDEVFENLYPFQFNNGNLSNVKVDDVNSTFSSTEIQNCQFFNNDSFGGNGYLKFEGSKVFNSQISSSRIGVGCRIWKVSVSNSILCSTIIKAHRAEFNRMILANSKAEGSVLIELYSNDSKITNSSIIGSQSSVGLKVGGGSIPSIELENCVFSDCLNAIVDINNNSTISIINSNFSKSNKSNVENLSESNITATSNYWDSDSPTIIASKIYDQNDNLELGLVDISGFLTTPNIDAPISPPQTIVKTDNGAGGLTITWLANPESDIAGYKVYWGDFTGYSFENTADAGNVLTYTIPGLSISDSVAVTAYDNLADGTSDQVEGHQSWFSFAMNLPEAPLLNNPHLVGLNQFRATWSEVQNATSYYLMVSPNPDFSLFVEGFENLEVLGAEVDITGLEPAKTYWFNVKSKNSAGVSIPSRDAKVVTLMFTESSLIPVSDVFQSVSPGIDFLDIHNDGDLEMIMSGGSTTAGPYTGLFEWKNDGFSELVEDNIQDFWASSSVSGDINMDGLIDIIIYGDNRNYERTGQMYTMDENGYALFYQYIPNGLLIEQDGRLVDYDNDGDLDLYHSSINQIFKNKSLVFGDVLALDFLVGSGFDRIRDYDIGDYDLDGDLDLVVSYIANVGEKIRVWKNIDSNFEEVDVGISQGYASDIDFIDWDSDGDLDIALSAEGKISIYNNQNSQFSKIEIDGLLQYTNGTINLMDFFDANQDGLLDLMIFGEKYDPLFGYSNTLYFNTGTGFDPVYDSHFEKVSQMRTKFADVDSDGDLDYIVSGRKDDSHMTNLYLNEIKETNNIPDAPSNLQVLIDPNKVVFSWDKANDMETPQNGLNYNLYIGKSPGSQNIRPAHADLSTGFRRIVGRGDIQSNSWYIKGLAPGTYYWSVQAIDASYAGGAFAEEQSFTITGEEVSVLTITSFSPKSGPIGTSVTITGTNFNTGPTNNIVYFGATKAIVSAATTTELVVIVPDGATYEPITVLNTETRLITYSSAPFVVTFEGGEGIDTNSFENGGTLETGSNPKAMAVGDFDKDGKVDLVVTHSGEDVGALSIYRNVTSGSASIEFAPKSTFATTYFPMEIITGDLDGDSYLDLILINDEANAVSVHKNISSDEGNVAFTPKSDFSTGRLPTAVNIGDFDNDGELDLAVVNREKSVSILRNSSTLDAIQFDEKVDFTTSSFPVGLTSADFDGDNRVDIVVVGKDSNIISVYINQSSLGSIDFSSGVDFDVLDNPNSVTLGDFNNDGKMDLVVAYDDGSSLSVFFNTNASPGELAFENRIDFPCTSLKILASDLDGDSLIDIVGGSEINQQVEILRNNFEADLNLVFSSTPVIHPASHELKDIAIADFDNDARSDILVLTEGINGPVTILKNNIGQGALSASTDITSFSFPEQSSPATINTSNHLINIPVGSSTNVTALKASFTLSTGATAKVGSVVQTNGVTANNFTNPVTYTITAQDGVTAQNWVVTVTKQSTVNNPPTISAQSFTINENSINGTVVGTVQATDPNGDALTFSITSGTAFAIGATSGILMVEDKTQLDYEANTSLSTIVRVSDGSLNASATITVNLNDVNEVVNQAPQIISNTFILEENITNGESIGFVNASDPDGNTITYSIPSGNQTGAFLINISTGEIKLVDRNKLDFDLTDRVNLTVAVTDGSLSASATIVIDLNNPTHFSGLEYPVEHSPLSTVDLSLNGYVQDMDGISEVWLLFKRPTRPDFDSTKLSVNQIGFFEFNDVLLFDDIGLLLKYKAWDQHGNPTATDEILVPSVVAADAWNMQTAGGSGKSVKNYNIIAFPFNSPNVDLLFNELGTYNKKDWRLHRLGDNGFYQEYGDFQNVSAGEGYWFIVKKDVELKVGGRSVALDGNNFVMDLKQGYNLIGNPFLVGLDWNKVVEHNVSKGIISSSDIDVANQSLLYAWNTAYVTKSILDVFEGGIVKTNKAITGFQIPTTAIAGSGNRSAFMLPNPKEVVIDGDSWEMNLYFKTSSYDYYLSGIGVKPDASDQADHYDRESLPHFVLYLDPAFDDGYTKSIKRTGDFKSWSFTTPNNLSENYFELSWDMPVSVDKTIILVDGISRVLYDLKDLNDIRLPNQSNAQHYLYYGNKEEIHSKLNLPFDLLFELYPNPVTDILNMGIYSSENKSSVVELISIDGRSIFNTQLQLSNGINNELINLEELNIPEGIYFLKLDDRIMTKFIKQ